MRYNFTCNFPESWAGCFGSIIIRVLNVINKNSQNILRIRIRKNTNKRGNVLPFNIATILNLPCGSGLSRYRNKRKRGGNSCTLLRYII